MNLRNRILNFEHWISSYFKLEKPEIFQRELLKIFLENKEAYSYYRNWLYRILLTEENQKELNEFCEILNAKAGTDGHRFLLDNYLKSDFCDIFSQKKLNVFEIAIQNQSANLNHNKCFLYQQYYEIESLLFVLASFVKLNEESIAETRFDYLKDRNGNLKKGVMINYLTPKLKKYPLIYNLFNSAYNAKLRNTIGHNNYRIENDKIVSIDGNVTVSKVDFFTSLVSMQSLNNYLINYFSNQVINTSNFNNVGILGAAFGIEEDRQPVLTFFQLSCFYRFGEFQWADKIVFNIKGGQLETNFGYQVPIIGQLTAELENTWFNLLKENDFLRIYLTPIMPRNVEKEYITLDVGDFVTVGNCKIFDVQYKINTVR